MSTLIPLCPYQEKIWEPYLETLVLGLDRTHRHLMRCCHGGRPQRLLLICHEMLGLECPLEARSRLWSGWRRSCELRPWREGPSEMWIDEDFSGLVRSLRGRAKGSGTGRGLSNRSRVPGLRAGTVMVLVGLSVLTGLLVIGLLAVMCCGEPSLLVETTWSWALLGVSCRSWGAGGSLSLLVWRPHTTVTSPATPTSPPTPSVEPVSFLMLKLINASLLLWTYLCKKIKTVKNVFNIFLRMLKLQNQLLNWYRIFPFP